MKSSLPRLAIALALIPSSFGSQNLFAQTAQTNAPAVQPAPATASKGGTLSFLSEQDKARLMKAHEKALADNPNLQTEQDALKKESQELRDGDATMEDKMAFMQKMQAHQQKVRAAMLKADPTLGPVLDKVEAAMKEKFKQRAGNGN